MYEEAGETGCWGEGLGGGLVKMVWDTPVPIHLKTWAADISSVNRGPIEVPDAPVAEPTVTGQK